MINSSFTHCKNTTKPNPAKHLEQRIAIIVVIAPFIGTIAAIYFMFKYGISWIDIVLFLGMYAISILGITAGFHRLFTHRSFQAKKILQIILAIAGSMAAQGPPLFWVACHRRHHQNSDRVNDPHSPNSYGQSVRGHLIGLWYAHIGWMFSHNSEDWFRFVPELLKDRLIFRINQWYFLWLFLSILIPGLLGGLLTREWQGIVSGVLWGGFVRIFLVHHATWSINSICHLYGSRPYETGDQSTNNFLCALLAFGEGWHNNHHTLPTSAKHGFEWWQIDITYLVINLWEKVGLVWDVKLPLPSVLSLKNKKLRAN